nr:MAG TPA: tail protein [Caudoviricetes sp.]
MANTVDIHYGGAVILSVMPDDSSYSYEELMARDQLVLNFSLADYVEIPVGAWVEHGGKRYTLLASGAVTMHHTRNWEYSLTLEAGIGHLGKYIVHNTTDTDRRVRFDLTDKASRHIKLLVDNLNERDGDGTWSAGHVLTDETDTEKLVTYSQSTILEALNAIADAYGTEWSVSSVISGGVEKHTLTLGKVEKNTGADALTLAYGSARVGGLNSGIARNNAREDFAISRLFVQGGERNVALDMQYAGSEYGSKTLLLPKDADFLFDGQKFSGEEGYDETKVVRFVTDTEGRYVEVYGAASDAAEGSYDGSDTYPMRTGTVSAVSTTPSKGDEAFVNIEDDTLGSAEGKEAIDYSALGITGEQFTMVFQTGALAGKEFRVNSYKLKADCGYFELAQETIDGVVMPQVPGKAFAPKAGDKYAVFGMKMPDAYIAAAQKEMLRLATASLYVYRNAQFTLRDSINQQWAKRYWTELALGTKFVIGGYVKYYNEALFPDAEGHIYTSRITAVKRGLNNPYDIELTVSDKPGARTVASEFKRIDDGEVHGKEERDGIIQYTKRSLRDTLETAEALMESKLAGYGDAISPIVVQTMQMIAGDETLQFDLWTDRTCTTRAASVFAYDYSSKVFSASSCALRHLTIGIDDIAPLSSRKTEDYLRWTMSAFESAALTDSEARYYLYARVNASNNGTDGTDGTFVLSAAAIDKDAESGWWHLLVGILNRENDGTRSFVTVYGFTEVLPGQITTDIIRSADGRSFLNLLLNKFHLGDDVAYIDWNNFILNGLKIKGDVEADTLKLNGKKDSSGKTTVTADINGLMAMRGTDGEDITAFLDGVYGDGVIFGAAASDAFAKSLAFAKQEDDLDVALRPDFLLYRKGGKVKVYIKDLDSETTISLNAAVYGLQQQMSGKLDKSVFDKLFTVHYKEGSATEIESLELNYGTWTTGFLSVRGLDDTTGSGSGGTDLPAVWESLTKNEMPYQDVTINTAHIPVLPQSKVTGLSDALSSLRSGYTGISALIPQAATADNQLADKEFVNSSIATATATFRGTFATLAALEATPADRNDYAFWAHKDEDGNTCYDKYTYDGSAWKFEYRLNNSSFTAAQWGAINSGITGALVTRLSGISDWALAASKPSYTTAEVTEKTNLYFTNARAKSALSGHTGDTTIHITAAERKAWNAKWDWNEAAVKAVKVNAAGEADKLANSRKLWGNAFNGTADVNGDITLGSGKRIYFGSTSYYIELVNGRLHTNVGLYSDKFISARGSDPDAGGGSGASLPVVWASLQGNTDDYKDKTIHQAHIPTLPVSRIDGLATALAGKQPLITADSKLDYSLLKNTPTIGNGTITIKQGTNSQTFSTNQGDNKTITLTDTTYESKTAASGGTALSLVTTGEKYTWNNKQAAISDLATIRTNAATAYGWGDHSEAGYITGITKAMVESVLTGNITSHTHTFDSLTSKPTTLSGYGITDALPLTGGTISGWLIINASTLPISELTTDGITNNTWNSAQNVNLLLRSANNAMTISLGGQENERKGIIQVGHSASSFAKVLGDLYLNKFGGKVYIGEKLAYHEGNANKSDVDWNAANLTAEKRLRIKNANVIAFLSTDAMPKERLLGPMSSYGYDLAWHNGAQWNKVYHSGNFIDGTDYISPKTTLEGYGIEDWIVRNTGASPDTFTTSGNYRVSTVGTSGNGYNFNYGQVLVLRGPTNSDTIAQIAVPYSGSNLYFRSGTVSNFTDAAHPWWTIFTSGNCNLPTIPWNCSSLTANGHVIAKNFLFGQGLEFSNMGSSAGHGGYIDFHFNGSTEDYTSRIIESAFGKLHLVASLVRIGNGPSVTFAMSGTSYDYIWTEYPGAALILGTADGGGTNSSNSAIFIKGKRVYIGGTETGNNALNVLGVAHATTGIYTDGYISARKQDTSSDIRLKTDFRPLDGALKYIRGTHFTRFRWKDGSGESVGIIAQEEQSREYGFLVRSHGEIGHLTYDYAASTALLGAALQEEDEKVEALKRRVKELENKLDRLKQSNHANR